MNKKIGKYSVFIAIGVLVGIGAGVVMTLLTSPGNAMDYHSMEPGELHSFVVEARDHGIHEAHERGDFRCCIDPPCTMCYMEANPWNYFEAGTCACDDLIAKGEEPCPQCADALKCDSKNEGEELSESCLQS